MKLLFLLLSLSQFSVQDSNAFWAETQVYTLGAAVQNKVTHQMTMTVECTCDGRAIDAGYTEPFTSTNALDDSKVSPAIVETVGDNLFVDWAGAAFQGDANDLEIIGNGDSFCFGPKEAAIGSACGATVGTCIPEDCAILEDGISWAYQRQTNFSCFKNKSGNWRTTFYNSPALGEHFQTNDDNIKPGHGVGFSSTLSTKNECPVGAEGDPHFHTWGGESYDYQGGCDLVLVSAPKFANDMGLNVHLRTTTRYDYSYIESAAIQIGPDVLEVSSFGDYFFNGVEGAGMPSVMASDYPIAHTILNTKQHLFEIVLTETDYIQVKSFKGKPVHVDLASGYLYD